MDLGQRYVALLPQHRPTALPAQTPANIEIPRGADPVLYLLGVLAGQLRCLIGRFDMLSAELVRTRSIGANTTLSTYAIGTTANQVLAKDTTSGGKYRKVQIWVDSDVGGPTVTLRVGPGISSTADGMLLTPGQMNDLGEVSADMELNAVASSAITIRVFEKRGA